MFDLGVINNKQWLSFNHHHPYDPQHTARLHQLTNIAPPHQNEHARMKPTAHERKQMCTNEEECARTEMNAHEWKQLPTNEEAHLQMKMVPHETITHKRRLAHVNGHERQQAQVSEVLLPLPPSLQDRKSVV